VRNHRLLGTGLTVLALGLGQVGWPGLDTAIASPVAGGPAADGPCGAFPGAHQLPGGDGVVPAAWSGGGLVVPACGPAPGGGVAGAPVHPYPDAPWTAGYQCVEFSERYLYDRYGVTMNAAANGDQVVADYAAMYPGLFTAIKNGTPHHAPAPGDVLSLSVVPGFDSPDGGHTAVVQSSTVSAAGNGTVTAVEENASAAGVTVFPVSDWTVRYPGFGFAEWLTTTGLTVTSPHPPRATADERYSFTLTATGGQPPYRWRVAHGALPPGLALSTAGALTGVPRAGPRTVTWPVTVAVTDTSGAIATGYLKVAVADAGRAETAANIGPAGKLRHSEWAWYRLFHMGAAGEDRQAPVRRASQN
jgi:hypothetical protein